MEQVKRSQFAHYFDTTPGTNTKTYVVEGYGVEALSLSYNAQIDTFKSILDDVADNTFDSYQIQSSVSGKRIYKDEPMYEFLNGIRKGTKAIETTMIEIDMTKADVSGAYDGLEYKVLITLDEFLGEKATISYNLNVKGTPVQGKVTISSGVPTFVANGTASL